jgi:predicted MPP superfamily phosphohydrolase
MTPLDPIVSLAMPAAQILAWRFWISGLPKGPGRAAVGGLYLAVNALAFSVLVNWFWIPERPPANPVAWSWFYRPILLWQLVHLAWLIICAVALLIRLPLSIISKRRSKGLPSLFRAKKDLPPLWTPRLVLLLALMVVAGAGYLRGLSPPDIERVEVGVPSLAPPLDNMVIALVSDVHYGRGSNWSSLKRLFETLAAVRPDLLIIAGDLIDKNPALAADLTPLVADLAPAHGVYAVLGEGDLVAGPRDELSRWLGAAGVTVLDDASLTLAGVPLTLIGLTDKADPDQPVDPDAASGPRSPDGVLRVVVTHRPRPAAEFEGRGIGLYLTAPRRWPSWSPVELPGPDQADALYGPAPSGGPRSAGDLKIVVAAALGDVTPGWLGPRPKIILATLKAAPL